MALRDPSKLFQDADNVPEGARHIVDMAVRAANQRVAAPSLPTAAVAVDDEDTSDAAEQHYRLHHTLQQIAMADAQGQDPFAGHQETPANALIQQLTGLDHTTLTSFHVSAVLHLIPFLTQHGQTHQRETILSNIVHQLLAQLTAEGTDRVKKLQALTGLRALLPLYAEYVSTSSNLASAQSRKTVSQILDEINYQGSQLLTKAGILAHQKFDVVTALYQFTPLYQTLGNNNQAQNLIQIIGHEGLGIADDILAKYGVSWAHRNLPLLDNAYRLIDQTLPEQAHAAEQSRRAALVASLRGAITQWQKALNDLRHSDDEVRQFHNQINEAFDVLAVLEYHQDINKIGLIQSPALRKLISEALPETDLPLLTFAKPNRQTAQVQQAIAGLLDNCQRLQQQVASAESPLESNQHKQHLAETRSIIFHLQHYGHLNNLGTIVNGTNQQIVSAYQKSIVQDAQTYARLQKLKYYLHKGADTKFASLASRLNNQLPVDCRLSNTAARPSKVFNQLLNQFAATGYQFPEATTDWQAFQLARALNQTCKHYLENDTSAAAKAEAISIIQALQTRKHLEGLGTITDEYLQKVVRSFTVLQADTLLAQSLLREYDLERDSNKKEQIYDALCDFFQIDKDALTTWHRWIVHFPFGLGDYAKQQVILKELAQRDIATVSQAYNSRQQLVQHASQNIMQRYKELVVTTPTQNADETDAAYQQRIRSYTDAKTWCRELLNQLAYSQKFTLKEAEIIAIPDTGLRAIIQKFNQQTQLSRKHYRNAKATFERFIKNPLIDKASLGLSTEYDEKFHEVLKFLFTIYRKQEDLQALYAHYFTQNADTVLDPQLQLQRFANAAMGDVLAIQATDFSQHGVFEAQVVATLREFKKRVNRWCEQNNLEYALRRIPPVHILYRTCRDLLTKLPPGPERHRLASYFDKHFNEATLTEQDIAKLTRFQAEMTEQLRRKNIAFTLPRHIYEVVPFEDIKVDKQARRELKGYLKVAALLSTVVLTIGQTLIVYASLTGLAVLFGGLIVALPVLGPMLISAIAIVGSFATLITNYVLFKGATFDTLVQFFLRKDYWNGFTSIGGKGLMLGSIAFSLAMAVTMGVLVAVSAWAALPIIFPFALPGIILAGMSGIIAATTFVGFTCLIYVTLAGLIKGTCNVLERLCPEIAEHGWGWHGLTTGIKLALVRFHNNVMTPGKWSVTGGYGALCGALLSRLGNYIKNPTGNPAATTKEIWTKRLQITIYALATVLFGSLAVAAIAVGTFATVGAWHAEMVGFLTGSLHLSEAIATGLSIGIVVSMTGFAELIFNSVNIIGLASFLGNKTVDAINATGNAIMAVANAIIHPVATARHFKSWCTDKAWPAICDFADDLAHDPKRTLAYVGKKVWDKFTGIALVAINAVGNAALVLKGRMVVEGVTTVSFSDAGTMDWSFTGAAAVGSLGATGVPFIDKFRSDKMDRIPLMEIVKQQAQEQDAVAARKQQLRKELAPIPQAAKAASETTASVPLQASATTRTEAFSPLFAASKETKGVESLSKPAKPTLEQALSNWLRTYQPAKTAGQPQSMKAGHDLSEVPSVVEEQRPYQPGTVAC